MNFTEDDLIRYIYGELESERSGELAEAVDANPELARQLDELSEMKAMLDKLSYSPKKWRSGAEEEHETPEELIG